MKEQSNQPEDTRAAKTHQISHFTFHIFHFPAPTPRQVQRFVSSFYDYLNVLIIINVLGSACCILHSF